MGLASQLAFAESHFLQLRTINIKRKAISGVILAPTDVLGNPSSFSDSRTGKLRIKLDDSIKANSWITLTVFNPKDKYVFLSPLNGRVQVPSVEAAIAQDVVLIAANDQGVLQDDGVILVITAQILKLGDDSAAPLHRKETSSRAEAIAKVAESLQLKPSDVEEAINAWISEKKADKYQNAIAAMYQKRYADASKLFVHY